MATRNHKEPQTIQAKFGFADNDLKTPVHDEILLALDQNMEAVCAQLLGTNRNATWNPDYVSKHRQHAHKLITAAQVVARDELAARIANASGDPYSKSYIEGARKTLATLPPSGLDLPVPPYTPMRIDTNTWEYALRSGTYTVGFVDVVTTVSWDYRLELRGTDARGEAIDLLRAADVAFAAYPEQGATFYFEIKSTIPSLGELVRQIRFYENYAKPLGYSRGRTDIAFVVVSPDTRWRNALESQGICFVAYPFET